MSNLNSIYNFNGVPLFTYGMIGITTVVLAFVTMMEKDNDSFAKDDGYDKTTQDNGSMFESITGEKKEEGTILESITGEKKEGGKYKNRKTKHNKRQNTYTRRN